MKTINTRNGYIVNLFDTNAELQAHTDADHENDTHNYSSIDCVLSGDRFEIEALVERNTDSWKRFLNSIRSAVKATKLDWIDSTIDELFEGMKESIENGVWTFDTTDSLFNYRLEQIDDGQWYLYIRQDAFKAEEPEKEEKTAIIVEIRNDHLLSVIAMFNGEPQDVFQSFSLLECMNYIRENGLELDNTAGVLRVYSWKRAAELWHIANEHKTAEVERRVANEEYDLSDKAIRNQIRTITAAMNDLLPDDELIDLALIKSNSYKLACKILRSNGFNPGFVDLYSSARQLCRMRRLAV